ncbi:MAG: glycosyltransferase [Bacteroidales bacterium]|jgi:glycosyltransferase involved in cell wall biosynthesis
MERICVLLNGGIIYDSRVIKVIRSLSKFFLVDLYYIKGTKRDKNLFNENVTLFSIEYNTNSFRNKLIRHTFFYNEFNFLERYVLSKKFSYDYIYCNDLPTLKAGVLLKKKLSAKLIYDSHEIFIGTLNQFFPDTSNQIKKILFASSLKIMTFLGNYAELKMIKKIDFFITTNISFKEYFQKKFNYENIRCVMNCPEYKILNEHFDFRSKYNLNSSDKIFIFQGMLNKGRALSKLIEAQPYCNENIKLFILGDGQLRNELENIVKKLNLENKVFFIDKVPSNELLYYTKGADFGINLQEAINISKFLASANKLFEYIHANIPIVASDVPENRRIFDQYNVGILTNNDIESISNAINKIANMDRKIFIENCKKAALEYNWKNQEKVLLEIFK